MDTREKVADELRRWWELGKTGVHDRYDDEADAILAIFAEERAAFQKASYDARVACENQRKRAEKAEAREAKLVEALEFYADDSIYVQILVDQKVGPLGEMARAALATVKEGK